MLCCCLGARSDKVSPGESVEQSQSPSLQRGDSNAFETDRHCTDILFIGFKAAFIFILLALIIYCMAFGDIYRIINGYDDCANVCGRDNKPDKDLSCKGTDRTEQKYLLVDSSGIASDLHRQCVARCEDFEGYKPLLNRCVLKKNAAQEVATKTGLRNYFQEVSEDLETCYPEVLWLCAIAFVFSLLTLVLLRYIPGLIVWLVLIAVIASCTVGTIWLWVKWDFEKRQLPSEAGEGAKTRTNNYLYYAIAATIATVLVYLIVLVMRKRIKLVVQLFKEAGKAVSNMPCLLLEPILTFVSIAAVITLFVYFTMWIESSGMLRVENNQSAKYVKDSTMLFTRWYNLLAFLWFCQFIIGCQHMVIAGAVACWFFTRNKSNLGSPILKSFGNLVRYHMGTVALGSFIIAVVQFLRAILKLVMYYTRDHQNRVTACIFECCQCCLKCFEQFLQYLTRNAYIMTAMHGDPFCTGGKNAFRLLSSNALRVFAINSVGDFVLILSKVFVVVVTCLIGMEVIQKKSGMHHPYVPIILVGIFAYLVAHCFMTVYEMTVDTIFLSFCEDCETNDGINKPYFMSRGLMEFVQNSKKALAILDNRTASTMKDGNAWTSSGGVNSGDRAKLTKTISETVD
ncbi:choline transporter-like protein 1 [Uranotaenia lowii]|uniref:choline transporter-like protein 1 n=1 Tax=Uranotaenia lowii TaxID=190385 RepID=UPI00247AF7A9|nr:choline transporter-like protein 1 [Uranotaenia lowii]